MTHQPQQDGYDYSTLEVDDQRLPETVVSHPDLNYPQPVDTGYQEVKPYNAYVGTGDHQGGVATAAAEPRIWGLKRKTFWISLGVGALVIVAIIVGVVAGLLAPRSSSSTSGDSEGSTGSNSSSTALLVNTKLASANFTDGQGNNNYLVVYQLNNRAIYLSAWNSSNEKWVVSPIIDGTTSISLDDVQEQTGLGLDVYFHSGENRDVHLYWQAPTKALRTVLYRTNLTTNEPLEPARWEDPYSIQDRYTGLAGSSLSSYGLQCSYCTPWTYFFWQGEEGGIHGAWRNPDSVDGWGDVGFTKGVSKPVTNTSLAVTNVPSVNGTASIDIFYQSDSGVLMQIIFDGEGSYEAVTLPRGNLGSQASIVAFATGYNDTGSDDYDPLGFQVLTTDRDSDTTSVHLTYYKDGSWTAGDEVSALSDCTTHASLAVNLGRRVYCVVDGDGNTPQIVEWSWAADPTGNLADYTDYDRVGVVDTPT